MALVIGRDGKLYDTQGDKGASKRLQDVVRGNNLGFNYREQELLRLAGGGSTTGQARMMVDMYKQRREAEENGRQFDLSQALKMQELEERGKDRQHQIDLANLNADHALKLQQDAGQNKLALLDKELQNKLALQKLLNEGNLNVSDNEIQGKLDLQGLVNKGNMDVATVQKQANAEAAAADRENRQELARIDAQARVDAARANAESRQSAARLNAVGKAVGSMNFQGMSDQQKQGIIGLLLASGMSEEEVAAVTGGSGKPGEQKNKPKDTGDYSVTR